MEFQEQGLVARIRSSGPVFVTLIGLGLAVTLTVIGTVQICSVGMSNSLRNYSKVQATSPLPSRNGDLTYQPLRPVVGFFPNSFSQLFRADKPTVIVKPAVTPAAPGKAPVTAKPPAVTAKSGLAPAAPGKSGLAPAAPAKSGLAPAAPAKSGLAPAAPAKSGLAPAAPAKSPAAPVGIAKSQKILSPVTPVAPAAPSTLDCQLAPNVILGAPTSNSINMKVMSFYPASVFVSWSLVGSSDLQRTETFSLVPQMPFPITLSSLQWSSRYSYTLWYTNALGCETFISDVFFFHTQRQLLEEFTFAVIADSHFQDPGAFEEEVFSKTRTNIMSTARSTPGYDFLVDLGDTFMGGKLEPDDASAHILYENVFAQYSPIACSVPLFLTNGNHDGEIGAFIPQRGTSASQEQSSPVNYARLRNVYFPNPSQSSFYSTNQDIKYTDIGELRNFYAWNWGSAVFIVLDPYWYSLTHITKSPWEWTLGYGQYEWLNTVLSVSSVPYKFVFIHQYAGGIFGTTRGFDGGGDQTYARYFEWGGIDPKTGQDAFTLNRPGWNYGPIHTIFMRSHVSVVFRGHDHLYHVGVLDNIIYNTLPKTSVTYPVPGTNAFEKGKTDVLSRGYPADDVLLVSGHTEVTVSKTQAVVSLRASDTNAVVTQYTVFPGSSKPLE